MRRRSKKIFVWTIIGLCIGLLSADLSLADKDPSNYSASFKKSITPIVNVDKAVTYNCRLHEYHGLYPYIARRYLKILWPAENQNIKLRSEPKDISWEDYKRTIYRLNMHDSRLNKNGCFRNTIHFISTFSDEQFEKVRFLDTTTNLAWAIPDKNIYDYSFDEAKNKLKTLNTDLFEGHSDWRLPTVEESASLYHRHYNSGIQNEFRKGYSYWTADWQGNLVWTSIRSFSYPSDLTWTKPRNPLFGQPVKEGLMIVRSQPKPYPQKYFAPRIGSKEVSYEEEQCNHWERYRANSEVIRKPDSPEWPVQITAKKLRSTPKQFVGTDDIDNDKKSHNSPVYGGNWSCFRNYFIDTDIDVVVDLATNLMWQKSSNIAIEEYKTIREKDAYTQQLNNDIFAGKQNWRTPTLQELSSIVETTAFRNDANLKLRVHIDPLFDQRVSRYMVADKFHPSHSPLQRHVVVDFDATRVDTELYVRSEKPAYDTIKAVRSLTDAEVQTYCKQIKGLTCQ